MNATTNPNAFRALKSRLTCSFNDDKIVGVVVLIALILCLSVQAAVAQYQDIDDGRSVILNDASACVSVIATFREVTATSDHCLKVNQYGVCMDINHIAEVSTPCECVRVTVTFISDPQVGPRTRSTTVTSGSGTSYLACRQSLDGCLGVAHYNAVYCQQASRNPAATGSDSGASSDINAGAYGGAARGGTNAYGGAVGTEGSLSAYSNSMGQELQEAKELKDAQDKAAALAYQRWLEEEELKAKEKAEREALERELKRQQTRNQKARSKTYTRGAGTGGSFGGAGGAYQPSNSGGSSSSGYQSGTSARRLEQ